VHADFVLVAETKAEDVAGHGGGQLAVVVAKNTRQDSDFALVGMVAGRVHGRPFLSNTVSTRSITQPAAARERVFQEVSGGKRNGTTKAGVWRCVHARSPLGSGQGNTAE
jgi:hypothetical protein